jgi:hypothetical protein
VNEVNKSGNLLYYRHRKVSHHGPSFISLSLAKVTKFIR